MAIFSLFFAIFALYKTMGQMRAVATTTLPRAKIPPEPYEITLGMLYTVGKRKDSSITYENIDPKSQFFAKFCQFFGIN